MQTFCVDGENSTFFVVHIPHKVVYIGLLFSLFPQSTFNTSTVYKMRGDESEGVRTMVQTSSLSSPLLFKTKQKTINPKNFINFWF